MFDTTPSRIPIIPGVNDTPIEPNFEGNGRGCNGSYFIEKYHTLLDSIEGVTIPTVVETIYTEYSTDFTAAADTVHGVNTVSEAVTATLPSEAPANTIIYFSDAASNFGINSLTIVAPAGETVQGAPSYALTSNNDSIALIKGSGGKWIALGTPDVSNYVTTAQLANSVLELQQQVAVLDQRLTDLGG
jgi:hypothetical protein